MKKKNSFLLAILLFSTTLTTSAFQSATQETPTINITQIDISEFPKITLYISAVDFQGNPVLIDASMLAITENGNPIETGNIEGFGEVGSLTTLLITDASGSMNNAGKLDDAKAAANLYIDQMRVNDQAGVMVFNTEFSVIQPLTQDKDQLKTAVSSIVADNNTAMYDALLPSIDILNDISGRTAIIVLTDGLDNVSTATLSNVLSQIGPAGITISTIGLGESSHGSGAVTALDEDALKQLASQTGGIYSYSEDSENLKNLYQQYATSMQSEYVVTYISPAAFFDGNNRSVTVTFQDGMLNEAGELISQGETIYNPGGLVPEVEQIDSWNLFTQIFIVLCTLLILPSIMPIGKEFKKKPKEKKLAMKPRIKFKS
jgi:VWFA-related protein